MGVDGIHLPGAALDEAARTKIGHEVAGREALADVLLVEDFSPGVDAHRAGAHDAGRQGDIGGDHHVPGRDRPGDMVVGRIEVIGHDHGGNPRRVGMAHDLVRDHNGLYLEALGRPEDDILHRPRAGVRVDPDFHFASGGPALLVRRRHFFPVLDGLDDILPDEAAKRARAIDGNIHFPLGAEEEIRRMQIGPWLPARIGLIKGAGQLRDPGLVHAVAHREVDLARFDALEGFVFGVGGNRDHLDAFRFEFFSRPGECRKLRESVGSPMAAVKKDDTPRTPQVVGQDDFPTADLVDLDSGKRIARIEYQVVHLRHD